MFDGCGVFCVSLGLIHPVGEPLTSRVLYKVVAQRFHE